MIPGIRNSWADHNNNALALIVLIQYIPRLYLIFPLSYQIIKATGLVTKTVWAGAAYNLLLYMIASHVCNFPLLSLHKLPYVILLEFTIGCTTQIIFNMFSLHSKLRSFTELSSI